MVCRLLMILTLTVEGLQGRTYELTEEQYRSLLNSIKTKKKTRMLQLQKQWMSCT